MFCNKVNEPPSSKQVVNPNHPGKFIISIISINLHSLYHDISQSVFGRRSFLNCHTNHDQDLIHIADSGKERYCMVHYATA